FDQTTYRQPLQLVWADVQIPVTWRDLRDLSPAEQGAEIDHQVQQAVADRFDWTQPPLLRFHFYQRSATTFQMIMTEHHAILDGWSVASLVTELFQTYRALLAGQPPTAEASVPYREFIAAEQASLASDS